MKIAIVGATGAVGLELALVLAQRRFPASEVRLLASSRSAGKKRTVLGREVVVENLETADPSGIDIALFSAGKDRARAFAPAFTRTGATVIDNSSAFRREADVPLIVPEINGHLLDAYSGRLVANPNCSTIAALLPLAALHRSFGLDRVLVSTYQAVSGAGGAALEELEGRGEGPRVLPRPIQHNLIPWIGDTGDDGFCEEETKIAFESRKILGLELLKISATTVRVPVRRCHALSLWVRLEQEAEPGEVEQALREAPGVELAEPPPCPAEKEGTDPVYVGRVRRDPDDEKAWWLWAVSDQLRKGAALNAVQIAERIHEARC
jgi:aspartate-semialdehyde dehydrogenase